MSHGRGRLGALALILALGALAAAVGGAADPECPRWRRAFARMPTSRLAIEAGGRTIPLSVKVALDPEDQAAGFQCATPEEIRTSLILFDFGSEIQSSFHMNNVPAPLDIAFAKGDGRIFAIMTMAPSPTQLYGPLGPFRYALEARAGFFREHGVEQSRARLVPGRP